MILLDTHIWIWWVHDDARLPTDYRAELEAREAQGLGVSRYMLNFCCKM